MKTLDCRAHKCPHPVVETRKLLLAEPGMPLTVLVGDETARENITRLAASQGYAVRVETTEWGFALDLSPGTKPTEAAAGAAIQGKTVAFIAADTMGSGSDELGRILLKNFLFTLTELETIPDVLLFVNAGVKLTTEGSEALGALEKLACLGADIASCGLCLDYYHLKDKLAVGRVTNMLDIAETLQKAGRTIRP
jgi:selenium metabolism protein YedF